VRSAALLVVATLLVAAVPAAANPMATYGYTARGLGLGGAMTAVARSFDATYYNPAGLARVTDVELGLGLSVRRTFLTVRHSGDDAATGGLARAETDRGGTSGELDLGLAAPIPLGEGRERVLFAGASVMLPGTTLYALRERPIEQPVFPFLEERNDRLVLNLAVAARWQWVMLGAGVSFLPNVAGRVDVDFTDGASKNTTAVDVGTSLAPTVGLVVLPVEGLSIGLAWRGENRLDLAIPVSVVISEKITAIDLRVTSVDHSTPHEVALGAAWQGQGWMVAGDVTYALYHRFRASFPDVVLFSSSGDLTSASPPGNFRDTWAVRLGGEVRVARGLDVRAGASWVQSPVPAQEGPTNLQDGDRFAGSLGAGLDLGDVGGPPLTIDAAVAAGGFAANRDAKRAQDPGNPGYPWIEGQGAYVLGALSVTARF
jgi:long-subunit fatty acid transport protein